MTRDEAVGLLCEAMGAEIQSMKEFQSRKKGITKATERREKKAFDAIFVALIGDNMTPEEWARVTG